MDPNQIGRLWENRFRKILEMEEESVHFYRELSEKNDLIAENPRLKEMLEEILEDEERHQVICKELVRIVESRKSHV